MTDRVSVGVVGGGIGGLTAALSLLHAGFDVHVYEQAAALGEVGAGIQISPNASRLLHRLGLADELARVGVKPLAWHQRRWDDGRTLLRSPLAEPLEATFGFPHYQLHRADLLVALATAIPAERVDLGHRITQVADQGDQVEARFANGTEVAVDVLVGADGIHSVVRRRLFGDQEPRFTGCVAYRGLVPAERLRDLELEVTAEVWMGPDRHLVHYFVSGAASSTSSRSSSRTPGPRSRGRRGRPGRSPGRLRGLASAGPHDPRIGRRDVHLGAVRPPAARALVRRRVTLLGDACHAMLPFMAQGAAQAIEDGATLTACLTARREGHPRGVTAVRTAAPPRASRLQAMSTDNKTRFHLPDGPEQRERDREMATTSTDWSFDAVAWIYEHDAAVVPETG